MYEIVLLYVVYVVCTTTFCAVYVQRGAHCRSRRNNTFILLTSIKFWINTLPSQMVERNNTLPLQMGEEIQYLWNRWILYLYPSQIEVQDQGFMWGRISNNNKHFFIIFTWPCKSYSYWPCLTNVIPLNDPNTLNTYLNLPVVFNTFLGLINTFKYLPQLTCQHVFGTHE